VPVSEDISTRLVQLEGAFGRVFESAMDWAEEDFRKEITAEKWKWPRNTKRRNGSEAGSPRDIVDLGGLLRSQRRQDIGEDTTVFVWTGEGKDGEEKAYALEVHDGYTAKSGARMPARAFTDNAVTSLPSVVNQLLTMEVKANG